MKKLLVILLILVSSSAFSSHVAGGNIAYSCTTNPNEFVITLTFYRDCSGIPAPNTIGLDIENDCGLPNPVVVLPQIGFSEVSQLCTATLPNSSCNGGPLSGVQEFIYQDTVDFGAGNVCDAWTMSFQVCARNPSTNLDGSECFYVETTMNSVTQACNNSPIITAQPIPYVCNNSAVSYNYGVIEQDGDSLDFSFVAPLANSGDSIDMISGFTYDSPIPGITIDSTTGQIDFTPVITGNFVVTILIKEYNCAGQLVGTLMHDIQFFIEDCVNIPPVAPATVTNFNAFGTNAILTDGNKITMCTGDQMCFDAVFTDQDALDQLVLSSNIGDFLPGATITQSGTNPATATVCWIFQSGYTGSLISVNATDQVCTVPGISHYVVNLSLPKAPYAGQDATVIICNGSGSIDLFSYLTTTQTSGSWYDPNNNLVSSIIDPSTIINNSVYTYVVNPSALNNCFGNGCSTEADSAFITLQKNTLTINTNTTPTAGIGNQNGEITCTIAGGNPPYDIIWSDQSGPIQFGGTTLSNLPGHLYYYLSVSDDDGCTVMDSIQTGFLSLNTDDKHIFIAPNPVVDGQFYVKGIDHGSIRIYDNSGRKVLDNNLISQPIILNLSHGIYHYEIIENGMVIKQAKLVVQS